MKFSKFSISLAILSLITFCNQCCLAYKDGEFPGKGSVQAWHQAAVFLRDGHILQDNGKYDEAIAKFKAAIAIYPYEPAAWGRLGNCYQDKKEYALAESAHRKATALNPDDWMGWSDLSRTFYFEDKIPDYKAAMVKALSCHPPSKEAAEIQGSIKDIAKYLSEQKDSAAKKTK